MRYRTLWAVGALTVVGGAYRLLVYRSLDPMLTPDGTTYVNLGANLWNGKGYVDTLTDSGVAAFWRPPFYPFVLGGVSKILGGAELAAVSVSMACSILLIPLAFAFARRLWNDRAGLWAALLTAGYVTLVTSGGVVGVEPLFLCLFLLFATQLWQMWVDPRATRIPLIALLACLLYLTRFEAIMYAAVAAVWSAWALARGKERLRRAVLYSAVGIVLYLAIASPYLLFLHRTTHRWMFSGATPHAFGAALYGTDVAPSMLHSLSTASGLPKGDRRALMDPRVTYAIPQAVMARPSIIPRLYAANVAAGIGRLSIWWPLVAIGVAGPLVLAGQARAWNRLLFFGLLVSVPVLVNPISYLEERSMRHVAVVLIVAAALAVEMARDRFKSCDRPLFRRYGGAAVAVAALGLILLHSIRWTRLSIVYQAVPSEFRDIGSWMREHGLNGQYVIGARQWTAYYGQIVVVDPPEGSVREIVELAARRHIDYLLADTRYGVANRLPLAALFVPDSSRTVPVSLVHEITSRDGNAIRLYRINRTESGIDERGGVLGR